MSGNVWDFALAAARGVRFASSRRGLLGERWMRCGAGRNLGMLPEPQGGKQRCSGTEKGEGGCGGWVWRFSLVLHPDNSVPHPWKCPGVRLDGA